MQRECAGMGLGGWGEDTNNLSKHATVPHPRYKMCHLLKGKPTGGAREILGEEKKEIREKRRESDPKMRLNRNLLFLHREGIKGRGSRNSDKT